MHIDPDEAKDPETKKITSLAIALAKGHLDLAKYFVNKGC